MSFQPFDSECMSLALRLARRGLYTCDPNPRVGCVIAQPGRVVGQGWHRRTGGAHAEVHALREAGADAAGATAYVTLEPCNHHGRTAPCSEALVAAGVKRVVASVSDPDSRVAGQGFNYLREAGIEVQTGLMAAQAEALNRGFFMRQRAGRPWVRIKTAISLDGRTGLANGESQWISSDQSRADVQRWRARSSGIMAGSGTVLADNPRFTARLDEEVVQPLRLVLDSRWRCPAGSHLLDAHENTVLFGSRSQPVPEQLKDLGVRCIPVEEAPGGLELSQVMAHCAELGINELQVEAGERLNASLLQAGLVDEVLAYMAPVLLGAGARGAFALGPLESMAGRTHLERLETVQIGPDLRMRFKPVPRTV